MGKQSNYFRMNLQTFGEGAAEPTFGSGATWDTPRGTEWSNPGQPEYTQQIEQTNQQQNQQQAQPLTQQQIEELDFGGRKVPVVDPVIKDLHTDYTNLNSTFTKTNQEVQQLRQQNEMMMQMVQQYQQQFQQQPNVQQQGPTAEQLQQINQTFMDKFYDNSTDAFMYLAQNHPDFKNFVKNIVDESVKPVVEPIQRERQYQTEVRDLSMKYQDFQQFVPHMQQIINQQPQLAELGLETVYKIAKADNTPNYTPDQLLNDPTFRQQILGREDIRNEIINGYVQNRQQTNQQVPPMMGTQPGGSAPVMQGNAPRTLREGSKAFLASLGIR